MLSLQNSHNYVIQQIFSRRGADVVLGWSRDAHVPESAVSANLLTGHLRLI